MKIIYFVLLQLLIHLSIQNDNVTHLLMDIISTQPAKQQFKLWHYIMKRPYDLNSENAIIRYKIFKNNLKLIEATNKKNLSYKLGLGPFTDITGKEFMSLFRSKPKINIKSIDVSKLPITQDSIVSNGKDWSEFYNKAKNQNSCGSCWAFATIGSIEGMLSIQNNKYYNLSEQPLIDCMEHKGDPCNEGSFVVNGLEYAIKNGIPLRMDYPYVGQKDDCSDYKPFVKIRDYKMCYENCTEEQIISIINEGPYASDIEVKEDLAHYKEGEYEWLAGECNESNHSLVVVQYDGFIFKVRNSWGPWWGIKGYGFMKKYEKFGNLKACGLLDYAYQPTDVVLINDN